MTIVLSVLSVALWLFLLFLLGRFVLDYVRNFARSWEPRGVLLVLAESICTVTDPPLKLLRRVIPDIRLGGVSIDVSFILLFIVVWILIRIV